MIFQTEIFDPSIIKDTVFDLKRVQVAKKNDFFLIFSQNKQKIDKIHQNH